ncbi:MAG: hypothetical protein ACYDBZ_06245 [Steroidobacteraceae bacterium]
MSFLIAAALSAGASGAESPDPPLNQAIRTWSVTMRGPLEQCVDDLAARDLESIRAKADLSRMAADGPPPFRIALNDTFATDSERAEIAKWLRIRDFCRKRFAIPRFLAAAGNAIEAVSLQQMFALSKIFQSSVNRLIRALYYQELTYGEFARRRYEFTRDAAALSSAMREAGQDEDQVRLRHNLQNLRYLRFSWNAYLRRVSARRPGSVHLRGAIST